MMPGEWIANTRLRSDSRRAGRRRAERGQGGSACFRSAPRQGLDARNRGGGAAQEEALPILVPTVSKVVLAFWPSVVMAPRQTTMISANITAYSTAVGPSSA